MSNTKKTIQINPELFKMAGNKTKKNKERKNLTLNPIISPNNLKNKLLKRIKEHKTQEFKDQDIQNQEFKNSKSKTPEIQSDSSNPSTYTDEFYGALDYLSDLSKKQKSDSVKQRSINTKTLKKLYPVNSNALSNNQTNISLELPPELQETNTFIPQTNEIFNVNYKKVDDVPYGCLKNGKKKTYREWKEINNNNNGTIDIHDIVRPPTPPKKNVLLQNPTMPVQTPPKLSREEHLEQIKNKLKQIQNEENEKKQETNLGISSLEDFSNDDIDIKDINQIIKEKEPTKTYFKQTLKKKFTLGKSDKLRRVSVLIKDNQTRKNIIHTQQNLKKTSITDVRKYLRQHGMIKVGTTCPQDILRKVFESAVLTGEITNTNKETLLHNFLSSEPEE